MKWLSKRSQRLMVGPDRSLVKLRKRTNLRRKLPENLSAKLLKNQKRRPNRHPKPRPETSPFRVDSPMPPTKRSPNLPRKLPAVPSPWQLASHPWMNLLQRRKRLLVETNPWLRKRPNQMRPIRLPCQTNPLPRSSLPSRNRQPKRPPGRSLLRASLPRNPHPKQIPRNRPQHPARDARSSPKSTLASSSRTNRSRRWWPLQQQPPRSSLRPR
uniref:(northern house mosquito) hypothetical protein n=1 Tax=Culex pipiens TaxID=7175 RepID=A0A8D8HXM6_CULPI